LSIILERYFEDQTDKLRSAKVARGHGRKMLAFFGATVRVKALTETKQKEFVEHCLRQGLKLSYVARIMVTMAASLSHSKLNEPEIIYTEAAMTRKWRLTSTPPTKAYIPTDEECARLVLADMPVMLQRWIVIQMMTGGRPQTGVDLAPPQFNRDSGIVDLNPALRPQNKKYRAKVRAGRTFRFLLNRWQKMGLGPHGDRYCGYSTIEGVKSALQRVVAETGIPVSTYSWRQKVTTVLRRARVPEDQIADLLGHRRPHLRTTAGYGDWDPDYQREAAAALDAWFWHIRRMARELAASQAANSRGTPDQGTTLHRVAK
jgi:integrase